MKIKSWHALAILFCTILLAYYPAFSAPLNSVDDLRLANYLLNRPAFSWQDFIIPGASSFFRPLVNSSFIIDRLLWDMAAPFLHFENVMLHLLNVLLLFALARQLCRATSLEGLTLPLCAALLFGLHPLNVEAVVWISGRADLLTGTFVLLSLNAFWRYLSGHSPGWLLLAVIAFFFGSLAKETALFLLPGLFFIALARPCGRVHGTPFCWMSLVKPVLLMVPFAMSVAVYFPLRTWALSGRDLGLKHVTHVVTAMSAPPLANSAAVAQPTIAFPLDSWLLKVEQALKISGFYAKKMFWPFPLNFGIVEVADGYFWIGIFLFLVAILLLWRLSLAGSLALAAMSLAAIALFVAFGGISWTPVAERYMYVPSAVLALSCTLGLTGISVPAVQRWLPVSVACLLIVFFTATFQRSLVWQDNARLFADTVEKSPGFAMVKNQLAMALLAKGEKQQAYDIFRSLDVPASQQASLNRIMVIADEGNLPEARRLLRERLKNPGSYEMAILLKLAGILEQMMAGASSEQQLNEYRQELLACLQAVWEETRDPFHLYRMGRIQMASGDRIGAGEKFSLAAKLFADDSVYKRPAEKLARSLSQ